MLFLVILLLIFLQISLKRDLISKIENGQKKSFQQELIQEKEKIKKDLDEKYRADMVSFEAMKKRLDIEKEKRRELENRLLKE